MNKPVILYRSGVAGREEDKREHDAIAEAGLVRLTHRAFVLGHSSTLVIPRYSLWPWVAETLTDIEALGGVPINDRHASSFVRSTLTWAYELHDLTPSARSWGDYVRGALGDGPVVLKVGDKARKDRWNTHMFAADRSYSTSVYCRLIDAGADVAEVVVRPYVKFEPLRDEMGRGILDPNGCPAIVEHRVFVLDGTPIARGFYWTPFEDDAAEVPDPNDIDEEFLRAVIRRIDETCPTLRFYAIDVARKPSGDWEVVEINDGCQSGPADCDVVVLYQELAKAPLCRK